MWYVHSGILLGHKKEGNPAICDNIDGPCGHYAKRNKSDREEQILYDITYMWNVKRPNSETVTRMMVTRS